MNKKMYGKRGPFVLTVMFLSGWPSFRLLHRRLLSKCESESCLLEKRGGADLKVANLEPEQSKEALAQRKGGAGVIV